MDDLYLVGTHVSLSYLNDKPEEPTPPVRHDKFLAGTQVRFMKLKDVIVMSINEPAFSINVNYA